MSSIWDDVHEVSADIIAEAMNREIEIEDDTEIRYAKTAAATLTEELSDMIKEAGLRVVFWTCPSGCRGFVDWDHTPEQSVATCRECGEVSEPYVSREVRDNG